MGRACVAGVTGRSLRCHRRHASDPFLAGRLAPDASAVPRLQGPRDGPGPHARSPAPAVTRATAAAVRSAPSVGWFSEVEPFAVAPVTGRLNGAPAQRVFVPGKVTSGASGLSVPAPRLTQAPHPAPVPAPSLLLASVPPAHPARGGCPQLRGAPSRAQSSRGDPRHPCRPRTVLPASGEAVAAGRQGAAEGSRPQRAWPGTGHLAHGFGVRPSGFSSLPSSVWPWRVSGPQSPSLTCKTEAAAPAREVRFPAPSKARGIWTWAHTHGGGGEPGAEPGGRAHEVPCGTWSSDATTVCWRRRRGGSSRRRPAGRAEPLGGVGALYGTPGPGERPHPRGRARTRGVRDPAGAVTRPQPSSLRVGEKFAVQDARSAAFSRRRGADCDARARGVGIERGFSVLLTTTLQRGHFYAFPLSS